MESYKKKKCSDEQIISALLSHGTIRAAAEAAGISERAVYNRMNNNEFKSLYDAAKAEIIRTTTISLNSYTLEAINTIVQIMNDETEKGNIRIAAAQAILDNAEKFSRRCGEMESSATVRAEAAEWGLSAGF